MESVLRRHPRRRRRRARRLLPARRLLTLLGIGLVVAGLLVVAIPLWHVLERGRADQQALDDWNHGGSQALRGAVGDSHDPAALAAGCRAANAPADDYALVSFPSLPQYHYAGVAGDGDWSSLERRSMVHYKTTAAPGAAGNSIIAFHREPGFEHIDELAVGATVTVEDRACHIASYRVTGRWTLDPDAVTRYLTSTTGHDLTLVTCTPWYVDNQRIVWRASLVSGAG